MDSKLLKNAVLFRLRCKCGFGNSAKVKATEESVMELIGPAPATMNAEEAADRLAKAMARIKVGQKLLVSPEYEAIKTFQS